MPLDNDTRGWIMTCVSALACVLGASIVCVDIIVRQFPGKRDFSIHDSNGFLSASLSLSFGVMLFSALYNMLPNSKHYLIEGGYGPKAASWILIALFLGGVLGIQILSNLLHRCIPHHIVDCDHTHDADELDEDLEDHHGHVHSESMPDIHNTRHQDSVEASDEETPLLTRGRSRASLTADQLHHPEMVEQHNGSSLPTDNRPSLIPRTLSRTISALGTRQKSTCDETGPCMGFSDACGTDCFKVVSQRNSANLIRPLTWTRGRSITGYLRVSVPEVEEEEDVVQRPQADSQTQPRINGIKRVSSDASFCPSPLTRSHSATHHYHHPPVENGHEEPHKSQPSIARSLGQDSHAQAHHHHIPNNAFMSIGLQTSIAIALHKLPEGFITYATNHANPTLGFSVFMALFIHNITEGFALALPLYLALNSRGKAMIWAAVLGGLSQPIGAGIAAIWFKAAGEGIMKPGDRIYGGMFAVTSGVMTSVALSLYSESLTMTHSKGLCTLFAFIGMGILGISSALTAK